MLRGPILPPYNLRVIETGRKFLSNVRLDLGNGNRTAEELGQRRHADIAETARHDIQKIREIRIDIERKAMIRDPAPHADADRGDFSFSYPYPGQTGFSLRL
jgi:hypothetical protein